MASRFLRLSGALFAGLACAGLLSACQTSRAVATAPLQVTHAPAPGSPAGSMTLYGGKGYDFLRDVACGKSGCFLYGRTDRSFTSEEDFLVIRASPSGTAEWARAYGGTSQDQLRTGVPTRDGGALLVGESSSLFYTALKVFSPHKWPRPLLIRIDDRGTIQWAATVELSGPTWRLHLEEGIQTADGGFLLGGFYQEWKPDAAQKALQEQQWLIRGAMDTAPSNAVTDAVLVRLDASGHMEWLKRYQLQDAKYAHASQAWALLARSNGGFHVALYDGSDGRAVLMSIDGKGNPLHTETLQGVGDTHVRDLVPLPGGRYMLLANTFQDKTSRSTLLAEFGADGALLGVRAYPLPDSTPLEAAPGPSEGSYCIAGRNGNGTRSRSGALLLSTSGNASRRFSLGEPKTTEFFAVASLGGGRCLMAGSTLDSTASRADLLTFAWQPASEGGAGPEAESIRGATAQEMKIAPIGLQSRHVIHFIPADDIRITDIPVPGTAARGIDKSP